MMVQRLSSLLLFWLSVVTTLTTQSVHAAEIETTAPLQVTAYKKELCQPRSHNITDPTSSTTSLAQAPEQFTVTWKTTADVSASNTVDAPEIVIEVIRDWSPNGADRFYQLILDHYYDCAAFFRVVPGFVVQFGIASDPAETKKWDHIIPDDPVVQSNLAGYLSFATSGPNTRTTQVFINTGDNTQLDGMGFSPFGRVIQGMDVVRALYNPTPGNSGGAEQGALETYGNAWLLEHYPNVDLIQGLPQVN